MVGVRTIDVLSDSTGHTAERVVRAALLQFPNAQIKIRLHPRVRTPKAAAPVLERVAVEQTLLVFSVVSPELSEFICAETASLKLRAIDVIGSVIGRLENYLEQDPIHRPGALLPLSEEYFRRIEAVEFTVKNDGGRDPRKFAEADLILIGVSRTSKTPLATLLAQRGLKVANLTLVLGNPPPAELDVAPQDHIVGLTTDVDTLVAIRQQRLRRLGMPSEAKYALHEHVNAELEWAEQLFARHPEWPIVNMTGRSVEETAGIILQHIEERRGAASTRAVPRSQR